MKKQQAKWREQSDKDRRDWAENSRVFHNFIEPGSFPVQATKASPQQVDLHIVRQQALGERMIGDHDEPRRIEFVVTGLILLAAIGAAMYRGWL